MCYIDSQQSLFDKKLEAGHLGIGSEKTVYEASFERYSRNAEQLFVKASRFALVLTVPLKM